MNHELDVDMLAADWFVAKVRCSEKYAQNLYCALCNNDFVKNEVWPILKDETWSCSWRGAGGLVAQLRGEGDYMDWYCSGMAPDYETKIAVTEGDVTAEIREDLFRLGWIVVNENQTT